MENQKTISRKFVFGKSEISFRKLMSARLRVRANTQGVSLAEGKGGTHTGHVCD